jgi:TonB family protein
LVEEVLTATGCKTNDAGLAVLEVSYDQSGAAAQRRLISPEGPQECQAAAASLLSLIVLPEYGAPGAKDMRVLPRGHLECAVENERAARTLAVVAAVRADPHGLVREPKRLKDVQPVYPKSAIMEEREGRVVLDTTITATGCVGSIAVLAGPGADLEVAAVDAVSQRRYAPSWLNDAPIPVITTETITFRLPTDAPAAITPKIHGNRNQPGYPPPQP